MRHPRALLAASALCLSGSLAAATAAAQGLDYDATLAAAARQERAGQPAAAAATVAPLAAAYPEDHAVALRLAWLTFSAADYPAARRHYTRALALSADTSVDARLGLAWTLLRLGDADAARARFAALAADPVAGVSAREGLALARSAEVRPVRAWAGLYVGAQLYAGHPQRRLSLSVTPSLTLQLHDLVLLGATYRALDYDLTAAPPQPGRPPTSERYLQQEFYASAGIVRPGLALRLHYGRLWDAANTVAPADLFGASARVALRGELYAEASVGSFADETVVRALGQWSAALSPRWSLGPAASVQSGSTGLGGSLGAQLTYHHDGLALSLSGRFGDERRVVSLDQALTFATDDRIRGALSLSARIPLGRGISLAPSYDWLHLTTGDALRSTDADAHFITLGVLGAW